jgi:hypothetical protein
VSQLKEVARTVRRAHAVGRQQRFEGAAGATRAAGEPRQVGERCGALVRGLKQRAATVVAGGGGGVVERGEHELLVDGCSARAHLHVEVPEPERCNARLTH